MQRQFRSITIELNVTLGGDPLEALVTTCNKIKKAGGYVQRGEFVSDSFTGITGITIEYIPFNGGLDLSILVENEK